MAHAGGPTTTAGVGVCEIIAVESEEQMKSKQKADRTGRVSMSGARALAFAFLFVVAAVLVVVAADLFSAAADRALSSVSVKQTPDDVYGTFYQWDQKKRLMTIPEGNVEFTIDVIVADGTKLSVNTTELRATARAMFKALEDSSLVIKPIR